MSASPGVVVRDLLRRWLVVGGGEARSSRTRQQDRPVNREVPLVTINRRPITMATTTAGPGIDVPRRATHTGQRCGSCSDAAVVAMAVGNNKPQTRKQSKSQPTSCGRSAKTKECRCGLSREQPTRCGGYQTDMHMLARPPQP
jgi:hypothetical protein